MAIEYLIEKKDEFLSVTTFGFDEDIEEVINYGKAVYEAAISNNSTKILCDERNLIYKISEIDTIKVAENASHFAPKLKKLAIVYDKKFTNDAELFETIAINRGLTVRFFCDYQKAIDWLLSSI